MKTYKTFTKVHLLDDESLDTEKLTTLISEDFITLFIIKRSIAEFDTFLDSAELACTQVSALSNQRVVLIESDIIISKFAAATVSIGDSKQDSVANAATAVYKQANTESSITFDEVVGFSTFPKTGKIAYVITAEEANFLGPDTAFSTVISELPG